ncbi:MAG TPA: hypothetical protein VES88_08810 [Gemmatimonadaceae bacterium]|nr:hypothetical protein [Gemmatimonadaceae bacterium]
MASWTIVSLWIQRCIELFSSLYRDATGIPLGIWERSGAHGLFGRGSYGTWRS